MPPSIRLEVREQMHAEAAETVWGAADVSPRVLDPEEAAQIDRARRGDERAVRWLLDRYRQRVVRLSAHILRDPEEAEDAAQEAFVRAFRNLIAYRSEARFFTWLCQIVVRVCIDRQRLARWRREERGEPPDGEVPCFTGEVDTRLLVEALFDRLSPRMRAALVLREMEGMDYLEIAQALRIPVGTVRSRLNAARLQFRALWSEAVREGEDV